MRKITSLALVLFFPLPLLSQQTITGYVHDALTHKPVNGANIRVNQLVINPSDSHGKFTVKAALPIAIEVSHVAYFSKEYIISKLPEDSLIFELVPNIRDLNEIQVSAKPYAQYFNPRSFYIQDFAIEKNRVWAIGYANKNALKPELRVLNLSGKLLDKMPIKPNSGLYQDPSGGIHLYNRDSIFELQFESGIITPVFRNAIDDSWEVLLNLQVMRGDTLIFRIFNPSRACCEFIAGSALTGRCDTVFTSFNRSLYASAQEARSFSHGPIVGSTIIASPTREATGFPNRVRAENQSMKGMSDKEVTAAESNKAEMRSPDKALELTLHSRDRAANSSYNRLIRLKPIKAQMVYGSGSFYVFEANNMIIWRLNPDYAPSNGFEIGIDPDAVDVRMIQDPTDQRLYLSYKVFGTSYVSMIDEITGRVVKTRKLDGFPFAEKVQINNGTIYFIYQTATGHSYTNLYSIEF